MWNESYGKETNQRLKILRSNYQRVKYSILFSSQKYHSFVWIFPRLKKCLSFNRVLYWWTIVRNVKKKQKNGIAGSQQSHKTNY